MIYNLDSTPICLETALEILDTRCALAEYPQLSDLLGSDWGFGLQYATPEQYKAVAEKVLRAAYRSCE